MASVKLAHLDSQPLEADHVPPPNGAGGLCAGSKHGPHHHQDHQRKNEQQSGDRQRDVETEAARSARI